MNLINLLNDAISNKVDFIIFKVNKNEGAISFKKSHTKIKIVNIFFNEKSLIIAEIIHHFFNTRIPFINKNQTATINYKYREIQYILTYELISKNSQYFDIIITLNSNILNQNLNKMENIIKEAVLNSSTDYFESKY